MLIQMLADILRYFQYIEKEKEWINHHSFDDVSRTLRQWISTFIFDV